MKQIDTHWDLVYKNIIKFKCRSLSGRHTRVNDTIKIHNIVCIYLACRHQCNHTVGWYTQPHTAPHSVSRYMVCLPHTYVMDIFHTNHRVVPVLCAEKIFWGTEDILRNWIYGWTPPGVTFQTKMFSDTMWSILSDQSNRILTEH